MSTPSPEPSEIRVGDAERDQVINTLYRALDAGQIDYAELDQRASLARKARFRGDLVPLTADLVPAETTETPPTPDHAPVAQSSSEVGQFVTGESGGNSVSFALMSGTDLSGDWLVAPNHTSIAVMGGNSLDMSWARLSSNNTTVYAMAVMGAVEIQVPEDVRVIAEGLPLMGGFGVSDHESVTVRMSDLPANAPTITVRGFALMGAVTVTRIARNAED